MMVRSALPEYVDIVPVNKIIAFSGDYSAPALERVWGHLVMARENIAYVLAQLIDEGRLDLDQRLALREILHLLVSNCSLKSTG